MFKMYGKPLRVLIQELSQWEFGSLFEELGSTEFGKILQIRYKKHFGKDKLTPEENNLYEKTKISVDFNEEELEELKKRQLENEEVMKNVAKAVSSARR